MRGYKKPIIWNGQRFESLAELARHLDYSHGSVGICFRNGYRCRGHYIDEIKEDKK